MSKVEILKVKFPFGKCICNGEFTCDWCTSAIKKLAPTRKITLKEFQNKLNYKKVGKNNPIKQNKGKQNENN